MALFLDWLKRLLDFIRQAVSCALPVQLHEHVGVHVAVLDEEVEPVADAFVLLVEIKEGFIDLIGIRCAYIEILGNLLLPTLGFFLLQIKQLIVSKISLACR